MFFLRSDLKLSDDVMCSFRINAFRTKSLADSVWKTVILGHKKQREQHFSALIGMDVMYAAESTCGD